MYHYEDWFLRGLGVVQAQLQAALRLLMQYMPFANHATSVALVVLLTTISVVPVLLLTWIYSKRRYKQYPYPYLTSTFIWVICTLILILDNH